MSRPVVVAFASGSEDLIPTLVEAMRAIAPDAALFLVSEFQLEGVAWIPYLPGRTFAQNLARCRAALRGKQIRFTGLILQPRMPYSRLRLMALALGGLNTIFFNEQLDHFLLRPRSALTIARHIAWRLSNIVRWELRPGGATYTFLWRLLHPWAFERPMLLAAARVAGWLASLRRSDADRATRSADPSATLPEGISVIVPSRNGKDLLARLLPGLTSELDRVPGRSAAEVIVVDNGSSDGTAEFLCAHYPAVRVIVEPAPLSFARAVNRGVREARFSHTMLLNNDMVLERGFFEPLLDAFRSMPNLFCATAQIFFPPGERRQETGKAVAPPERFRDDFPVICVDPVEGEDRTPVLYGSGGCSLYDSRKLRALGGLLEVFEPAYVEDLDLGFRAWQRGWPTVFVAGAKLEHRHRATTSRYFTREQLDGALELNHLKFISCSVVERDTFRQLWRDAIVRLNRMASRQEPDRAAMFALRRAWRVAGWIRAQPAPVMPEQRILAAGSGDIAVFPGRQRTSVPAILVASPYLPFPLAHGGAVRMYNLMREAARGFSQILVCFTDELATPAPEMLDLCSEIVLVRRRGSHMRPLTHRPDVVEEFDTESFRAALRLAIEKWRPAVVQLEFTQTAAYAADCAPARTVLVEHDVTLDLYAQLLERGEDWETRQQYERWVEFEKKAWAAVDRVVVMSEKDRLTVGLPKALTLANGVDLDRFQPGEQEPTPARLLFIGSFAHLPNVLAVDFFLSEVWPAVRAAEPRAVLHIISGLRPEYFLNRYRDRVEPPLHQPGVELEAFVADPRPAYRAASVVVAPLLASAGTNIKIMEAMAMGKAVVSTPAGINGLDNLRDGHDLFVTPTASEMASAIVRLCSEPGVRRALEQNARVTVENHYGWRAIGEKQRAMYRDLIGPGL